MKISLFLFLFPVFLFSQSKNETELGFFETVVVKVKLEKMIAIEPSFCYSDTSEEVIYYLFYGNINEVLYCQGNNDKVFPISEDSLKTFYRFIFPQNKLIDLRVDSLVLFKAEVLLNPNQLLVSELIDDNSVVFYREKGSVYMFGRKCEIYEKRFLHKKLVKRVLFNDVKTFLISR